MGSGEPASNVQPHPRLGLDIGAETLKAVLVRDRRIEVLGCLSIRGRPLERLREILVGLREAGLLHAPLGLTGTGAPQVAALLGVEPVDEPNAIVAACNLLYPDARTVIEMGRETQKCLRLEWDDVAGRLLLDDASLSSKCAAGSGSFIDHMSRRLNYGSVEEFARVAMETDNPAALSGRCAVFTESDIVHLYQKGTPRARIAAGVHQALCRNFRSAIARGKEMVDTILCLGGLSLNPAVRKYLALELGLAPERITVPAHSLVMGAIGAALRAPSQISVVASLQALEEHINRPLEYIGTDPLNLAKSTVLQSKEDLRDLPRRLPVAALGVDIGSVSTKAALVTEVDGKIRLLASYYRRTDGDPLTAVRDTVSRIRHQVEQAGFTIGEIYAGTTGSGRYLTGDYLGADVVKNEITAQAQGARAFTPEIESILEIGGQDSKYLQLKGDVIVDFEMNKACAAGTGAFLEKQAQRLGLDLTDFGPTALRATRPPDLDWTCTVFSESASVYYQQNNVPIEDLCAGLCLASVKNYLHKNVGARQLSEKVAFQGAVAFNQGMVAAFETVLGRPIVVPPHPHLTGAIGVATLAYRQRPAKSSFRGFDQIARGQYQITSFECQACPNRCDVNVFQLEEGPKYFYNDRCERYSGAHKRGLGEGLPDLFAEREQMLMEGTDADAAEGAPTVGLPRGLMFAEYYPLYRTFFQRLGFKVVPSSPTNKQIIARGLNAVAGEPCFPIKVAHGHVAQLLEAGVDHLFLPGVCDTEQPNPSLRQSHTCPYVMAGPDVIAAALHLDHNPKLLTPRLFFKRGERHLRHALGRMGRQLGKSQAEVNAAITAGLEALREFRRRVEERGREILEHIGPDQRAFVVIGRPYTAYDPALNMDIGKKIQDMGLLALPQDFLPLDAEDISDSWPNAYSRQIQKKLAAARLIARDPRLRAVVLTYFACGPDSFANPFFKDEIGEPCYVMQIDEHTADAGVITRMEAFADTAVSKNGGEAKTVIRTNDMPIASLNGRRLWVPNACGGAEVLAAALRAFDVDAAAIPRSPDPGLNLARRAISEDVCLPMLVTTQDLLERASAPDFDPAKEAFFQGQSEGPCRFGMYYMLQKRLLDKMGLGEAGLVTLGSRSAHGGLGFRFLLVAWAGLVGHDMLEKLRMHTRPYELVEGMSDSIFARYLRRLCDLMPEQRRLLQDRGATLRLAAGKHTELVQDLLRRAQRDFAAVPRRNGDGPRPLIGVVGEFFVRLHDGANQRIIRKLEQADAEVWLAPMTEFFSYANCIDGVLSKQRWQEQARFADLKQYLSRALFDRLAMRDEHHLFAATLPYLEGFDDIGPGEVIENGARYVHPSFGGETICSLGKSVDFARRGLDGIVNVIPFNCMPGNTVTMLSQAFRRDHHNLPFLNLDYDGFVDSSRDAKIVSFMSQVKERRGARQAHRS
jgi:predicted CoA-substrate-specific enzyme activase